MKRVIVIVFVLGCFFQSFSQEEKTKSKSFFGVKAGFNAIKLSEHEDKTLSFGYQFGATYTISMSKRFSFQPEVLFQTTNYSFKSTKLDNDVSIVQEKTTKTFLILFPTNFKYRISKKVDIDFGPTIGFIAKRDRTDVVTQEYEGNVQVFNFDPDNDPYSKDDNKLALAFNLGVNYNFTENIYLGLRYSLFFAEFQNTDSVFDTSLFALSLGYSFK